MINLPNNTQPVEDNGMIKPEWNTFFQQIKTTIKNNTQPSIAIDKNEYLNLNEEQIKKKLNKCSKKHLYHLVNNDCKYKSFSKDKIVDLIYQLNFMDAT